ncbi:MAG: class I SAM-dependent methyltransferase [Defluviitaleaceae bacterium]|nr:class I SAM-dependent methyltransferase [Defluviitaleaceae bacterium]
MNEERFTGLSDLYDKYRPVYPSALIEYLYKNCGFKNGSVIADVGSGTGIFTRRLLEKGSLVYGVEPNADMRNAAEANLKEFDNFASVAAPAEKTGLPNGSVDFVTAAQAAHWFDAELFRAECKRILRPGCKMEASLPCKLALVWYERDQECEIIKRDYAIREKYCAPDKKGLGENGGPNTDKSKFFSDGIYKEKIFTVHERYSRESYIGRNLSASYAPKKERDPEKHRACVRELGELFDEFADNGYIIYLYKMRLFFGSV